MRKRPFLALLLVVFIILLTACDESSQDAAPTVAGDEQPQAVAVNPPRVWIDSPLADTALIFDGIPLPIVAHASFLSGDAILRVSDAAGSTLETIALEQVEQVRAGSGLLTRHEGQWLPQPQAAPNVAADGSVIYRLTVELGGQSSEPVILRLYMPTPTPSVTPTMSATPTITPSPSGTPSPTPTATLTASPTTTGSPSPSPSPSASPTLTSSPTFTATATQTATITFTPTATQDATDTPEISYVIKSPQDCEITPIRGAEVAARVGPGENRAARLFLEFGDVYTASGYNDDFGVIWWLTDVDEQALWVDSNQVIESGACGALVYVEAPPVIVRPPDDNGGNAGDGVTPVPGQPVIYYFTATPLNSSYCTTLSWSVEFVDAVYLDGQGVIGMDSREVCLTRGTALTPRTFTLVIYKNGVAVDQRSVTVGAGSAPPPSSNYAPTIISTSASPNACFINETVTMYVSFSDPEGNPVSISNAFTSSSSMVSPVAGSGVVSGNRASYRFRCIGDADSTVRLTITLSDGYTTVNASTTITTIRLPR